MRSESNERPILGGLSIATRALFWGITLQCALGLALAFTLNQTM